MMDRNAEGTAAVRTGLQMPRQAPPIDRTAAISMGAYRPENAGVQADMVLPPWLLDYGDPGIVRPRMMA